ncbi:hypothetical protein, partial [Leucothrix arctica]
ALKQAEISVSLSNGEMIATDTAKIVLMNDKLINLIDVLDLAKQLQKTHRKTLLSGVIPTVGIIGGVFVFNISVSIAIVGYMSGVGLSLGYAVSPLFTEKRRNKKAIKKLKEKYR